MIRYKKGDKVKVIDDNLSGVVTKVEEDKITIETDFGFDMTYEPKELLPDVGMEEEIDFDAKPIAPKPKKTVKKKTRIEKVFDPRKQSTEEKKAKPVVTKKTKKFRKPPLEIDLHYGQLENYDRLLARNLILSRQMASLKKRVERAREHGYDRVVIIHGKGEGVLEEEIKKWLNEIGYHFYDADFQRYKLGATEVELPKF
ncbi:Smr/MutS family protein [Weeksellaceae bacterium TAE3-ERU29]|nr:Smr/MutS family protein [Weeksellaceae bacterium TAE3-ERU29]